MTYTYAILPVSQATWDEIHRKLVEAGYQHALHEDDIVDMHGIAVQPEPQEPVEPHVVPLDDPGVPESLVPISAAASVARPQPADQQIAWIESALTTAKDSDGTIGVWMFRRDWQAVIEKLREAAGVRPPIDSQLSQIVQQPWTWTLALRMQSLLMLAMRGPDGCSKENGAKVLLRELRSLVLVPAFPGRPDSFMGTQTGRTPWDVVETFAEHHDEYPHHWVMHFIHACEVVGQFHPDNDLRAFWFGVYDRLCHAMHMRPEPIDALIDRLGPMPDGAAASASRLGADPRCPVCKLPTVACHCAAHTTEKQ